MRKKAGGIGLRSCLTCITSYLSLSKLLIYLEAFFSTAQLERNGP
ncbi:Unknown protein sequence [Pseudomonas syringae pv. cerasicola]|uniref:Uncharacterized protein n=1 Tax=Pseudomonas syringae pv. cerasicola TaxID=264451 RepID=A0A0P9NC49_PSESX|nr:Unknown protein sequence [Pseudomonas amygdali pv. morsprunorum]KPX02481.1 Unknown protein sequence [Pseudomonas syringae pv. cerasicola]